ncbi:MAG: Rne/Rng family ribonuclease [Phycisphaeraceae bacterium]|nr:Rne/Rng family ribonuclease [Phycisphaeraceae bacterium]
MAFEEHEHKWNGVEQEPAQGGGGAEAPVTIENALPQPMNAESGAGNANRGAAAGAAASADPARDEAPDSTLAPSAAQVEDEGAFGQIEPVASESHSAGILNGEARDDLAADEASPADALPMTSTSDVEAPSFMSELPDSFSSFEQRGDGFEEGEAAAPADGVEASKAIVVVRDSPEKREARSPDSIMLVNDVPGDECRIALVRKGRLESFFGERQASATSVGNIYKGRVINVEPAIQAAFVDFGENQNGFLHVSDLHPRYFPGAERTEAVGRKIPRRDRPPIQEALKRGQEILVQVIKEGLGTKGPTLTSYLSIPGRLLVMMPEMDNVGVSRKVDDEEQRRQMRKILDSLNLPEGFGFILRTAGFDRSRTELQRDAAYLMRLWQAMEKRMTRSGAPCELYTESDLLLRTIRDVVDDTVSTIVVDSESAYDRTSLFLEVAFPKDPPKVRFYDRPSPIFHAFGIEPQARSIYSREVPLPSGGALVFDQAEAMVAIDVNSGRSRSARDSETNAFNTNREAVDEICRQLRLRDLGGLVVCDLIDMRSAKHRREIEERFRENLRRDRAKTTVLSISEFGLIELTRQRMRPSVQKMHFMDCPHCSGIGQVQIPDSTAALALRDVQALLGHERVHRVEMVCSVKVASVILSAKRERLYEIERRSGKRVDVRISEALPVDRVDLYGYDERGADVEIARLAIPKAPALDALPSEPPEEFEAPEGTEEAGEGGGRRRRRRRRPAPADAASIALAGGFDDLPEVKDDEPSAIDEIRTRERLKREADAEKAARREAERAARSAESEDDGDSDAPAKDDSSRSARRDEDGTGGERRGKRRRRRGGRDRRDEPASASSVASGSPVSSSPAPRPAPEPVPPPDPRRVHLLAKDLGVSSKDLLEQLRQHATEAWPLDAKNHMSVLPSEWVALAMKLHAPEQPDAALTGADAAPFQSTEADSTSAGSDTHHDGESPDGEGGGRRKRRRRRGRRGRGGKGRGDGAPEGSSSASHEDRPREPRPDANRPAAAQGERGDAPEGGEGGKRKRRRRRRGRGGSAQGENGANDRSGASGAEARAGGGGDERTESGSRSASSGSTGNSRPSEGSRGGDSKAPSTSSAASTSPPPAKPAPRGLYARGVRRLSGPVKYDDR